MKPEQRHLSPFQTRSPVERAEQSRIILVAEEGEHAVALDVKQNMSGSLKFVDEICKKYMELRETLRPYVRGLMKEAHEKGTPVMRPLFYDFPDDPKTWEIEDQYMFGSDILVAPILYADERERTLYLPKGSWKHLFTGEVYEGGTTVTVAAPLDQLPVFERR